MPKLQESFYLQSDVISVARQLLGMKLFTCIDGVLTGGIIVETEAYAGIKDRASHAFGGRRTSRTSAMYEQGGSTYVYLCYGIHHLFNVVVGDKKDPIVVLIRALEPLVGIDSMLTRRGMNKFHSRLTAGPGALAKALAIDKSLNRKSLLGDEIWIETGEEIPDHNIISSARIGVAYAKEDALLPWRFYIKDNKFVSKPRLS